MGGFAGTGKTTLVGHICNELKKENKDIKIAFCSYTGKASRILHQGLKKSKSISDTDYIGTIHRLIYHPITNERDEIIGWEKIEKEDFKYSMIIVDEASMLDEEIWEDLLSFDVPVLAVGDHGQLPPVKGTFNLMQSPSLRLEEIYRQEKNNPIIKISEIARKYGTIPVFDFSDTVKKLDKNEPDTGDFIQNKLESFDSEWMILTGYNHTRIKLNTGVRQLLEFDNSEPMSGDRIICLKNNHIAGIYNGMVGNVISCIKEGPDSKSLYYDMIVRFDGEDNDFIGKVCIDQFNSRESISSRDPEMNFFDFGYALTVHKAQGGQAPKVLLFEERFSKMDDDMWRRWLYTGITRANGRIVYNRNMIVKRLKDEETIREACDISMKILYELGQNVKKGKMTKEIDDLAGKLCKENGVKPSFKSVKGYDYNTCISINNEVLHGLPTHKEALKVGDIVKVDFGVIYKGFFTDHCWTFVVEKASKEDMKLLIASKEATENALKQAITGNRTGDLGFEMGKAAKKYGFNTVWEYAGHGIGRQLHEDHPCIVSYGAKNTGEVLEDGLLVCVECQVVDGSGDVYIEDNGWTVKSVEGGKAGEYEYMAIVRENEPDVLTPMFDWPIVIK